MAVEQVVQPDWASLTPGSELAGLLEHLCLTDVADAEVVPVLAATWRQISHLHALFWAAMVQLGRREPAPDPPPPGHRVDPAELAWQAMDSWHWATHQIRAALTFSARRTDDEYGLARQLVEELPLVWQALSAGQLDPSKAKVFARYLINLTPAQSELICRRLLPRAPRWTSGQLAHRLLREVLAIDPTYARRRYEKAARERGVWGYIAEDGTAVLAGHGLSPTEAAAAAERLEQLAAAVRAAGHPHTERQLRADLFVRLLDGRYTGFSTDDIIAAMLTDTVYATDGDPEPAAGPNAAEPTADGPTSSAAEPAATAAAAAAATEPAAAGPSATKPAAAATEAAATEPGAAEPGAAEPGAAEPGAAEPAATEPLCAAEPGAAEPGAAEPGAAEPGATGTAVAQPGAAETGPERAASDPVVDEPAPAGPVIAESAAGEQEPVEPGEQPAPPQPDPAPEHPPAPRECTRAGVEVRVGLGTLLGLDDHPGELPGWGPVDAQEARRLVGRQHAAEWRFAVLDDDGYLIYGGLTRRRPTTAAARRGHRTTGTTRVSRIVGCRGGVVEIHIRAGLLTQLARSPDLPPAWAAVVADIARSRPSQCQQHDGDHDRRAERDRAPDMPLDMRTSPIHVRGETHFAAKIPSDHWKKRSAANNRSVPR